MSQTIKLQKKIKERVLFENIEIDVIEKGIIEVIGKSGSGKSTILNILNEKIQNKTITYSTIKKVILRDLSLIDNVKYVLNLKKQRYNELEVNNLFERLKISECKNKRVKNLSSGQEQRFSILLTFLIDSDVCIIDEPFAELDKLNRGIVKELIEENAMSRLVIVAIHEEHKFEGYKEVKSNASYQVTVKVFESPNEIKSNKETTKVKTRTSFLKKNSKLVLIGIFSVLLAFTLVLKKNTENSIKNFENLNYNSPKIYKLDNVSHRIVEMYDKIFDYNSTDLIYKEFNHRVNLEINAIPSSIADKNIKLKANEIIVSDKVVVNSNFRVFNIENIRQFIGKKVEFGGKYYIVKDVLNLPDKVVLFNDMELKDNYNTSFNHKFHMLNNEIEIKGDYPKENSEYIEIVAPERYEIGKVFGKHLVVANSLDDKFYYNEIDFKKSYLDSRSTKAIYSESIKEDTAKLIINSITYSNPYEELSLRFETRKNEIVSTYDTIESILIIFIIIFSIIYATTVYLNYINEIYLRHFIRTSKIIMLKDFFIVFVKKEFKFIITLILNLLLVNMLYNYIQNSKNSIDFNAYLSIVGIVILLDILIFSIIYLTNRLLVTNTKLARRK
ncbi:ABC transporter ATP-binding protein [Haploplasma axanthum]|uniref:ABC transporter ATPase n=1 Tax=Haploplasma axanthum TaxID=29552 RepID=A0A449BDE0_HAPAX|nr:ATP-binding cassette domain-containing protein [Haploplasma axanthum]VEU80445.1 ABC transporter ATPase [Haploplasma axanthum]